VKSHGQSWPCGAAFGNLDGDDRPDLVLTVHGRPGEFHVYLNRKGEGLCPEFEPVLEGRLPRSAFRTGIPIKGAHVAIEDMDNDGLRDIVLSSTWTTEEGTLQPVILRHLGMGEDGKPRFSQPPFERCTGYYAPGPIADYDRDGRLDIFHPTWYEEVPSILWRNVTEGGHWLDVTVRGGGIGPWETMDIRMEGSGFNPMGIGATVRIYRSGKAGQKKHLIGRDDITIGNGYSSGEEARAHFGLGDVTRCDVVVRWQGLRVQREGIAADRSITITVPETE
jgi:hypothetical protein